MGPIIAVLAFFGIFVAWAYFIFPPQHANERQVSVFNWSVMGACAMICLGWILNVGTALSGTTSEKYLLSFAVGGAILIEIVFLGVCFLLRNFWIFKPPRRPGSGGWF